MQTKTNTNTDALVQGDIVQANGNGSVNGNGLNKTQLIIFKLGNEEYGLKIGQIKEVVLTPHITKMPQTPPFIKGVANIRGNIIAIVDLEEKFGIRTHDASKQDENYTLVVESDNLKIGILVNEVPNTLSVANELIDNTSNILTEQEQNSSYMKGIVKLENRLIILIDIFKVLTEAEINKALTNS